MVILFGFVSHYTKPTGPRPQAAGIFINVNVG